MASNLLHPAFSDLLLEGTKWFVLWLCALSPALLVFWLIPGKGSRGFRIALYTIGGLLTLGALAYQLLSAIASISLFSGPWSAAEWLPPFGPLVLILGALLGILAKCFLSGRR